MNLEHQFSEIRRLIKTAKENSYKAVNAELIDLYWNIGRYISRKIENSEWGKGTYLII